MDYEKAYKEALERAQKAAGNGMVSQNFVDDIFQLRESEDERIRKAILGLTYIDGIEPILTKCSITAGDIRAYLAKQKELDKMIVVSPEVWDNAISDAFENGKKEGEKQKEQNSDTKECTDFTIYHPLKNGKGEYECIPYSFYGSLTSFSEDKDLIDFLHTCFYTKEECEEWIEKQKEQKPAEWSYEDESNLQSCIAKIEIDMQHWGNYGKTMVDGDRRLIDWLKNLTERFSLQPKQEWSEEDEETLCQIIDIIYAVKELDVQKYSDRYLNMICFLKSLRPQPHWKPSEEQMDALNTLLCTGDFSYVGQATKLQELYIELKKL